MDNESANNYPCCNFRCLCFLRGKSDNKVKVIKVSCEWPSLNCVESCGHISTNAWMMIKNVPGKKIVSMFSRQREEQVTQLTWRYKQVSSSGYPVLGAGVGGGHTGDAGREILENAVFGVWSLDSVWCSGKPPEFIKMIWDKDLIWSCV